MSYVHTKTPLSLTITLALALCVGLSACSDDEHTGDDGQCPVGEQMNPISGECEPETRPGNNNNSTTNNNNNTPDSGATDSGADDTSTPDDTGGNNSTTPDTGNPSDIGGDDTCPPGDYDCMCERDPNCQTSDTGTNEPDADTWPADPSDPDDPNGRDCFPSDMRDLVSPQFVEHTDANFKVALPPSASTSEVRPASNEAFVFEDAADDWAGFAAGLSPAPNRDTPQELRDDVFQAVQNISGYASATLEEDGHVTRTHDHFPAIINAQVALPAGTGVDEARDQIISELLGVSAAQLDHDLNQAIAGDGSPTIFSFEVISRTPDQYVIVGALATQDNLDDDSAATGIRVGDLVGGTSVARTTVELERTCMSVDILSDSEVDIIISFDASGSMGEEQQTLSDASFLANFVGQLEDDNLDWRVGVTGVECDQITEDTGLSQELRDLFPEGGGGSIWDPSTISCDMPFGGVGGSGNVNGQLEGGDFTTDVNTISQRINQVSTGGAEFTLTMGLAAADRALPRANNTADKFRQNATVIIVAVTDEADQLFKDEKSYIGGTNQTLSAADSTDLDDYLLPWINFALKPDLQASVFGLYWRPNEGCDTGIDVAHGIDRVVQGTGGTGGSICQPDIRDTFGDIADAAATLADGYRLNGVPIAQTVEMTHVDFGANAVVDMDRSRADGFDYESVFNRVTLTGPTPPAPGDRLIVPFFRWKDVIPPCRTVDDCPDELKFCTNGECH
jgi:hypothetical protein